MRLTTDADAQSLVDHVRARFADRFTYHYVERATERAVVDFARQ
jgi:uncharacterized protein (DUF2249 family)